MRRVDTPEILDEGGGSPEEIAASLSDLRRINKRYGGIRTSTLLLKRVARLSGKRELTMLDVAAGNGDVSSGAAEALRKSGLDLRTTLLDVKAEHFDPQLHMPMVVADALALPFHDDAFDVVTCSLFLHHLAPDRARAFCSEAMRVCRLAVVINDLERSWPHLLLIYAGQPQFSRITRHDSIASVRRAYTPMEMRNIVEGAVPQPARIEITRHYLFRIGVIVWKHVPTTA